MYLRLPENAIALHGRGDHLSRNNYTVGHSPVQQKRRRFSSSRSFPVSLTYAKTTRATRWLMCDRHASGKPFWRVKNAHTLDRCPSFFWEVNKWIKNSAHRVVYCFDQYEFAIVKRFAGTEDYPDDYTCRTISLLYVHERIYSYGNRHRRRVKSVLRSSWEFWWSFFLLLPEKYYTSQSVTMYLITHTRLGELKVE